MHEDKKRKIKLCVHVGAGPSLIDLNEPDCSGERGAKYTTIQDMIDFSKPPGLKVHGLFGGQKYLPHSNCPTSKIF